MSSERESLSANVKSGAQNALAPVDYNIAGNVFRVYYDEAHRPIFVLDSTQNELKPNVLLIIPESDYRKWDEILTVDWGVDLETVRPRKDNKYQKLDIEYSNLDAYSQLVAAYENGEDVSPFLRKLDDFRTSVVRRIALERLGAALETIEHAQNTIGQANDAIGDLETRLKDLRVKLSQQKKSIGREPTKQSAAKILKSDAQIDAVNDKLVRAKKRLASARRRLVAAEDDANSMRHLLDLIDESATMPVVAETENLPAVVPTSAQIDSKAHEDEELITEPKAEEMAEEDVKPLFDEDPEILDEEIAFKPIDFGAPVSPDVTVRQSDNSGQNTNVTDAPAPLSFTPPHDAGVMPQAPTGFDNDFGPIADVPPAPVLDSMRPVQDTPAYMPEPAPRFDPAPSVMPNPADSRAEFAMAAADAPIVQNPAEYMNVNNGAQITPPPLGAAVNPAPSPMPTVSAAPAGSGFRPSSPIRGNAPVPVTGVPQKSKFMYYVMLLILIALSIFTLWLYQRSTGQNIPEITTTTNAVENNPFISETPEESPKVELVAPEPVPDVAPVVPEPEPEPEPVVVDDEPQSDVAIDDASDEMFETVTVDESDVAPAEDVTDIAPVSDTVQVEDTEPDTVAEVGDPFLTDAVEKTPSEPLLNNILATKPVYNVSQQEKMFVADSEYETDAVVVDNASAEEVVCSDGSYPDANGCCGGEIFTDMEDGTFACCQPVEGGECFAPLR